LLPKNIRSPTTKVRLTVSILSTAYSPMFQKQCRSGYDQLVALFLVPVGPMMSSYQEFFTVAFFIIWDRTKWWLQNL